MPTPDFQSREQFQEWAEQQAKAFNARYGVRDTWSDEQLERALADHGLPALASLPGEPRGMMAREHPVRGPLGAMAQHRWRRTNASHLLGHVIAHGGERCDGCRDWGQA